MKSLKDIENLISALDKYSRNAKKHKIAPLEPQIFFRKKQIKDARTGIIYNYVIQDKIIGVWDKE